MLTCLVARVCEGCRLLTHAHILAAFIYSLAGKDNTDFMAVRLYSVEVNLNVGVGSYIFHASPQHGRSRLLTDPWSAVRFTSCFILTNCGAICDRNDITYVDLFTVSG